MACCGAYPKAEVKETLSTGSCGHILANRALGHLSTPRVLGRVRRSRLSPADPGWWDAAGCLWLLRAPQLRSRPEAGRGPAPRPARQASPSPCQPRCPEQGGEPVTGPESTGDQPKTLGLITVELGGVGKQVRTEPRLQARAEPRLLPSYFFSSLAEFHHPTSLLFVEENVNLTGTSHPATLASAGGSAGVLGLGSCQEAPSGFPGSGVAQPRSPLLSPFPVSQCPSPRRPTAPPFPPCQ